jgi:hypothetical protein
MAARKIKLNLADIQMGMELYNASPDGQRERERIDAIIAALPTRTVHLSGFYGCADGCCGACRDCQAD